MTASDFASISRNEWHLSDDISERCRGLLHGSLTFEAVVRNISQQARVIEVHRNKANSFPGYFRAHVKVRVSPEFCTVFHGGRSGYRAQYYRSIANGERANAFAVLSLTQAIWPQLGDTRLMTKEWIKRSLLGRDSKMWIHQGRWLRQLRNCDRLLLIARWIRELGSKDKKRRKLARWGSLVPQDEDRIDIKGTFLTLGGEPLVANPKQGRSKQLFELGFT